MANRYWVGGSGTWNTTSTTNWSAASALSFTASRSGSTLTTVGSPALVVGMTVRDANNVSLGTITGGSGNTWTTSGSGTVASQTMKAATVGASVPTSSDSVFFDANSSGTTAYTVTLTGALTCLDITVSANTPTFDHGTSPTLAISGSMSLASGTVWKATGTITFNATTTGKTITTNGTSISGAITFNGSGGGWTLGSALTSSTISILAGTFDTSSSGNYSVTSPTIVNTGSATCALNLNASTLTLSATGSISFVGSAFTFNAGTSQINITSTGSPTFTGGAKTFYNVSFTGAASAATTITINNANTFNNLAFTSPSTANNRVVSFTANQTINGTLSGSGSAANQRLTYQSDVLGGTKTLFLANAATISNADFRDITAATNAITATSGGGNCGGNNNITFPSPKTVYWNLAGTQNWAATAWATTPTGTPAVANFPLAQDTAVFTDSGAAGTITTAGTWNVGSVDMSGRTSAMSLVVTPSLQVYGSWAHGTGVSTSGSNAILFLGRGGTQTLTSNGATFGCIITAATVGGTVQLNDALNSTTQVSLTSGTLKLQSYTITCGSFLINSSTSRTLDFGTGNIVLTGSGVVWLGATATNFTTTSSSSTCSISLTSASAKSFNGGGATYSCTLNQGGAGALTIGQSNTFYNITNTVQPTTIRFVAGTTTTVQNFTVSGTAGNLVTLNSTVSGTRATLSDASGTVSVSYCSIQDLSATGGATWNAFTSNGNVDAGNNLGWVFTGSTTQNLLPSLYTNTNSFYLATLTTNYPIGPPLYINTNQFYSATVTATYTVAPALFANTNQFYAATVTPGAITLTPALVTNTNAFYSAYIAQSQHISPALYSNPNSFYSAAVSTQSQIAPSLFVNANAVFSHDVRNVNAVEAPYVVGKSQFYAPAAASSNTVAPALWVNTNTQYPPTVIIDQFLYPSIFENLSTFYQQKIFAWQTPPIISEDWQTQPSTSESWQPQPDASGSWQTQSDTSESWTLVPDQSESWTPQ